MTFKHAQAVQALALLAALGCQGQIFAPEQAATVDAGRDAPAALSGDKMRRRVAAPDGGADFETVQPPRYECSHPMQRGAGQRGARRLTRDEYLQSARASLGAEVVALAEVQQAAAMIPAETIGDITQEFQNEHAYDHVYGILSTAQALAKAVVSHDAMRKRVFGACAQVADRKCAEAYLAGDARRILKRPLDHATRVTMLYAFSDAGEGPHGLELVLARLLQAPEAVFHLALPQQQCDEDADGGTPALAACRDQPPHDGMFSVDAWTVAARLAYGLTGQGPDDQLLDAAERGELSSVEQARPHALRLLKSPEARNQLEAILDAWLDLRRLPTPNRALADKLGIDAVDLNVEARRELLDYALYEILERDADAQTLMTAAAGFPRTERMAGLYGAGKLADGHEPVALPRGHRGLLVRVAPLLSGQLRTSPILRGVYVRKRLLCDALASPDFDAVNERIEALSDSEPAQLSARQHVEQLTAPSECMACHGQINPLGFPLEGYDGFGARRDMEISWNADGSQRATHPLDTRVLDAQIEAGAVKQVANADELVDALATSTKYRACLAERLYTHAQLRPAVAADACTLSELEAALRAGVSVKEAWLRAVLNTDTFLQAAP